MLTWPAGGTGLGLVGWLSRRALSLWIFAPLVAFWYAAFTWIVRLPPDFLRIGVPQEQQVALAAIAAALVSDWLIVRAAKRAMTAPDEKR